MKVLDIIKIFFVKVWIIIRKFLRNNSFYSIIANFFIIAVFFAIAGMGWALIQFFSPEEIKGYSTSIQVVFFIFTASAGLFTLLTYSRSVGSEIKEKSWRKLHYLEKSYNEFVKYNKEIINAFDWPHILYKGYLPLCKKANKYGSQINHGNNTFDTLQGLVEDKEIEKIQKLDRFLSTFENHFYAIDQKLVSIDDYLTFYRYYATLLGDAYYDPKNRYLHEYIRDCHFTIELLLNKIQEYLNMDKKDEWLDRRFRNYPYKKEYSFMELYEGIEGEEGEEGEEVITKVKIISYDSLVKLLKSKCDKRILNVTGKCSLDKKHVQRQVPFPLNFITSQPISKPLTQNDSFVTYCAKDNCSLSSKAAQRLIKAEYKYVLVYQGGLEEWNNRRQPNKPKPYISKEDINVSL